MLFLIRLLISKTRDIIGRLSLESHSRTIESIYTFLMFWYSFYFGQERASRPIEGIHYILFTLFLSIKYLKNYWNVCQYSIPSPLLIFDASLLFTGPNDLKSLKWIIKCLQGRNIFWGPTGIQVIVWNNHLFWMICLRLVLMMRTVWSRTKE